MRALGLFGFLGVSFAALVAMDKITRPIVVKQTEQVRKSELFYIFLRTSFSTIALARELSNLVHHEKSKHGHNCRSISTHTHTHRQINKDDNVDERNKKLLKNSQDARSHANLTPTCYSGLRRN